MLLSVMSEHFGVKILDIYPPTLIIDVVSQGKYNEL